MAASRTAGWNVTGNNVSDLHPIERQALGREAGLERVGDAEPSEFLCPISNQIMRDPHIAADGMSYEKANIQAHFNKVCPLCIISFFFIATAPFSHLPPPLPPSVLSNPTYLHSQGASPPWTVLSPVTGQPLKHTNLWPNAQLRNAIERHLREKSRQATQEKQVGRIDV